MNKEWIDMSDSEKLIDDKIAYYCEIILDVGRELMDNSNYEDEIQPKLEELKKFIEEKEWHQYNNCKSI